MNNKTTFDLRRVTGKIPVALCYLLATSTFAQNTQEISAMQKKTDMRGLNALIKVKKNTLSLVELQSLAKKRNISFEGKANGYFYQLQGFAPKTNKPIYYITYNQGAGAGTRTNPLHNLGGGRSLEGKGITLHEWDAGAVRSSHQEFGGRVTQMDGAIRLDEHATHVAGTMVAAGVNGRAKGMAPKANLHSYDWRNDTDEMIEAAKTALISNHSYGVPGGFQWANYSGTTGWHWFGAEDEIEDRRYGMYGHTDALWDFIILKAPYYLPVKAAGNDRGSGPSLGGVHFYHDGTSWKSSNKERIINGGTHGFDCISSGNLGKNSLIIGAAQKIRGGYSKASDVVLAEFSSTGPTDDGRIKPDIVGIGVDILSTSSAGNALYETLSGTSMASPNVAGSLGLLQEHYKKLYGTNDAPFMKGATLKALAIHTANEAGEHAGPDYQHGWGLLDASKAVQVLSDRNKYSIIEENTLGQDATHTLKVKAKGNEPIVVTIAWDDAVPDNINTLDTNNRTPKLVNDLDVRISDGTTTFFPWVLNPDAPREAATKGDNFRDNVEQIVIESPEIGKEYTITVNHKSGKKLKTSKVSAQGGFELEDAPSQDFSLIATGVDNGVKKDLEITAIHLPNTTEFTSQTPVEFVIKNVATEDVTNATVAYKLINKDENDKVELQGTFQLPTVTNGNEVKQIIHFNLSKSFVNYTIEANIVSSEDQIKSNDRLEIEAYGVVSDLTIDNAQHHFSFENDFEKSGWKIEDTDNNGISWIKYNNEYIAKTGKNVAFHNADMARGVNDWLFSNPLRMKQNQAYKIILNVKKDRADIQENLQVYIGQEANSTAMVKVGTPIEATTEYVRYVLDYTPNNSGIFYVGFNHKTETNTPANSITIDDVSIVQAYGSPIVDFSTSTRNPNSYQEVQLTSEVVDNGIPVTHYEWEITPNEDNAISYLSSNKNDVNPKVIFNKEGRYNISLKATNAKGETIVEKKQHINVANTAIISNFNGGGAYYQGNIVKFTDVSKGNPLPNRWKWSVTPSEEVEFVNGTNENSQNPEIKFNRVGKYTINLDAGFIAPNGTVVSQHSTRKYNAVEIKAVYMPVDNLQGNLNDTNGEVKITWERPTILPLYVEDFEGNGTELPSDFTMIDEDGDKQGWKIDNRATNANSGIYSIYSESFHSGKFQNVNNWLITGKIKAGAEILKFAKKNGYKERLAIYIVPAPASGNAPTLEEITRTGKSIYSTLETTGNAYKEVKLDIAQHTSTENYIVFHHKTKRTDWGKTLYIDDIEVSYNTDKKAGASLSRNEIQPMGAIDAARLVGYEVHRNGQVIKSINDIQQLTHNDTITQNGEYTYDVYAVYSDGLKSEKKSITIQSNTLSTSEVKDNALKIYPNPSDGMFSIETKSSVTSLKAEVYDLSGKLIFKKDFRGNKAELNLTQYPKGVYILQLLDNQGNKHSAKLMIK